MRTVYFYELPIGAVFYCNGNTCKKKSTRTAWISASLWFYFGKHETVRATV